MKRNYVNNNGNEKEVNVTEVLEFLYHTSPVVRNEVEKYIKENINK